MRNSYICWNTVLKTNICPEPKFVTRMYNYHHKLHTCINANDSKFRIGMNRFFHDELVQNMKEYTNDIEIEF